MNTFICQQGRKTDRNRLYAGQSIPAKSVNCGMVLSVARLTRL